MHLLLLFLSTIADEKEKTQGSVMTCLRGGEGVGCRGSLHRARASPRDLVSTPYSASISAVPMSSALALFSWVWLLGWQAQEEGIGVS